MRLDTSGNLGIGTASPAAKLDVTGFARTTTGAVFQGASNLASGAGLEVGYNTGSSYSFLQSYDRTGSAYRAIRLVGSTIDFDIANSVKATIDSSGRLLVGDTTTRSVLTKTIELSSAGTSTNQGAIIVNQYVAAGNAVNTGYLTFQRSGSGTLGTNSIVASGDRLGMVRFTGANGTDYTSAAEIYAEVDGTPGASSDMPGRIIFATTGDNAGTATERARITSGGNLLVGTTTASNRILYTKGAGVNNEYFSSFENTNSSTPLGLDIFYSAVAPNSTGSQFLDCRDTGATRLQLRSNGGLANYQANNVDLSDARTKKDIIPAASMWGKVSALEIVTYKYNDQTHDDVNLGVIAQQVESVEPVWVENDGFGETPEGEEPLKTVYTKDIYFAAIKALQEAMARIEQLEAKFAALESK
jgi:hypothetical protein